MQMKLRSKPNGNVLLTAKNTIDKFSRLCVDAELNRVRCCVIPIITEHAGRPFLVGSAVCVNYRGRKCLVTALHVLSDNFDRPLFIFGADGFARPLVSEFLISEENDLATTVLNHDYVTALSNIPFLDETALQKPTSVGKQFYGSVVGYPHTASKLKDKITLDTPMEIISGFANFESSETISVYFNKKEGVSGTRGHVSAHDPTGMSGGAIFGMPTVGFRVLPNSRAMLVGIGTHWKQSQKRIHGASVSVLLAMLESLLP
jgi:hypothetical protein